MNNYQSTSKKIPAQWLTTILLKLKRNNQTWESEKDYDTDYSWMNGARRSALRKLAGSRKSNESMAQVNWTGKTKASNEDGVDALALEAQWMERLDSLLWKQELVNLYLKTRA